MVTRATPSPRAPVAGVASPAAPRTAPGPTLDEATPYRGVAALPVASPDFGAVELGGQTIEMMADRPAPLSGVAKNAIKLGLFSLTAAPELLGYNCWRTKEAALEGMQAPLVTLPGDPAEPFGPLVILKPGAANFFYSPAFVFRVAQYSGKVVLGYENDQVPSLNEPRPVRWLGGVRVPKALEGKIWALGSEEPAMIGIRQRSDVFIRQLAAIEKAKAKLGVDLLATGATVIGHSEGVADTMLTRRRLDDAHLGHLIRRAIGLGGGIQVGASEDFPLSGMSKAIFPILHKAGIAPTFTGIDLIQEYRTLFPKGSDQAIDLSVAGVVGPAASWKLRFGVPPFAVDDPNNIKPGIRAFLSASPFFVDAHTFAGVIEALEGASDDSDGLVPVEVSRGGKRFEILKKPHDHAGLVEDPAVPDDLVGYLLRPSTTE